MSVASQAGVTLPPGTYLSACCNQLAEDSYCLFLRRENSSGSEQLMTVALQDQELAALRVALIVDLGLAKLLLTVSDNVSVMNEAVDK